MSLEFLTGLLNWMFASLPGNPVYTILIIGLILYLSSVIILGGTDPIRVFKALIGEFNTSFAILLSTFLIAIYFIDQSQQSYFILRDILMIAVGLFAGRRLESIRRIG